MGSHALPRAPTPALGLSTQPPIPRDNRRMLLRTPATLFLLPLLASAQATRDLGAVHPANESVRVVAFGDFGYRGGDSGQVKVAESIAALHRQKPFHLGLTMGDNFYPRGVSSVTDPAWKTLWEDVYGPLGIPFYASLGNHDYDGNEQAQVDYTATSKSWRMPHRYYDFTAGPIHFFALDTDEGNADGFLGLFRSAWSSTQRDWLAQRLAASTSAWKIVYGHHPIYSDGHHGDERRLQRQLLPLLRDRKVDVYLAGHDHDLQHFTADGIEFLVVGGGGKDVRSVSKRRAKFAEGAHGFLELEATATRLDLRIRYADGREAHALALTKEPR